MEQRRRGALYRDINSRSCYPRHVENTVKPKSAVGKWVWNFKTVVEGMKTLGLHDHANDSILRLM